MTAEKSNKQTKKKCKVDTNTVWSNHSVQRLRQR